MKQFQLVQVTWYDARGADGWISKYDLEKEKPTTHYAVGYMVKDTPDFITITMSYNDELDNLGAWTTIPKSMVKKIKKL